MRSAAGRDLRVVDRDRAERVARRVVRDEIAGPGDGLQGLVVGYVRSVGPPAGLFREVILTPGVAFDRLEAVLIVQPPPRETGFTESVR